MNSDADSTQLNDESVPNAPQSTAFINPGTKLALLVMVGLMIGLKVVDTLVQEGGILSPSWKWSLYAGLCGGVFASVVNAYRLGLGNQENRIDRA